MGRIPGHNSECGSRGFWVPCQGCYRQVYRLNCNCGSNVVFDEQGWPWRKHDCNPSDRDDGLGRRGKIRDLNGSWSVPVEVVAVKVCGTTKWYRVDLGNRRRWMREAEIQF